MDAYNAARRGRRARETSGRRKRTTEERRGEEGKRCKRIRRSAKVDEQELGTIIERVLADETFHGQAAAAAPIADGPAPPAQMVLAHVSNEDCLAGRDVYEEGRQVGRKEMENIMKDAVARARDDAYNQGRHELAAYVREEHFQDACDAAREAGRADRFRRAMSMAAASKDPMKLVER